MVTVVSSVSKASERVSVAGSLRSFALGMSGATSGVNLKMERNLLERMVQERDEKIASLQKSLEVQNEHVNKLQAKTEIAERREKQVEQRHKLKLDNLNHEKNMLKSQLKVMHDEIQRIGNDPIHLALTSTGSKDGSVSAGSAASQEEESLAQIMPAGNPFKDEMERGRIVNNGPQEEKIKLANNAQGLLLQSQLYQALNSLKQLRQQTGAMKNNYDEIVLSLQQDLVLATDDGARIEVELLNQLSLLEQDKNLMQRTLEEKVIQKGTRIMRLEKRIRSLDMIEDDDDNDESNSTTEDEGNVPQCSADDPKLVPSHMSDDLRLHLQSSNVGQGSILSEVRLDTPASYSTRGGSIFSQESSSTCDAASNLLRESSMRVTMLLQKTASRAAPASIMEEEEDEEDNKSQGTSASDSVSVASGLLRESRLRAMKMLEKAAPRAAAESSEDGDEDLR